MPMKDGFRTLIFLAEGLNINRATFAEVTVKPPGLDARGGIDITSMRNVRRVTKWPKQLVDVTDCTSTCQWDPNFWSNLQNLYLGFLGRIGVQLPNIQTITFWGFLDKAEPSEHREGEVPLINLTVVASNVDTNGLEQAPSIGG